MAHPELAAEQVYVDTAYEQLDRMRSTVARTQEAMATEWAALNMEAWAKRRIQTFEDAERGLVFGRLNLDATPRPLYVGRRWVTDDKQESLVVNWQAPAARPFYTATPQDPHGVTQRRRFRASGRKLLDISDESLDGSGVEGAAVSDFLLEELDRRRDARMRDIVATIQSDQYRLITAEPTGALVIQGGPGTGKTAVGLHRASWLLYTHREQLRRVLVVGPNPTFMEYVSQVLPTLGEEAVEQRAVTELVDGVVVEREEVPDVARLKGDPRLREVVARAVELAVVPAPEELVLRVEGVYIRVRERDVATLLDEALETEAPLGLVRDRFRMAVLRRFYERYGELLGPQAFRSFDDVERGLRQGGFLTRWLDRVLPLPQPEKLVARLLTSPAALEAASEGVLDAAERKLLLRDRPRRVADLQWSDHDVALLDEARALLDGAPRSYGHVIVDEAQDLSPMQLLAISRRAVDGSLTILGDVAQATGPVVYRRWEELEPYLPEDVELEIEELRHAYRVPGEIMDFALPLLDEIAPEVEPPIAYRKGGDPPRLVTVSEEELLETALREAVALEDLDGMLAVIVPRTLAVPDEFPFPILTPRQAKGLEFDHVVVVEPAALADEGDRGLRELYVALTRPTKTLVVVHARPLPDALRQGTLLRVAVRVLLASVLASLLVAPAAGARSPSPSLAPYAGLGTWLDIYATSFWDNPKQEVAAMARDGVRTLYLQTGNYQQSGELVHPAALGRFIDSAHAAGLSVVAWYLPGFTDPAQDARRSLAAIRFRSPHGERFDSFALDIEAVLVKSVSLRNGRLLRLSAELRKAVGRRYALGAITFGPVGLRRHPHYWPHYPYRQLARFYDVFLPMAYTTGRGIRGVEAVRAYLTADVAGIRAEAGNVPIHLIGGLASGLGTAELTGFRRAVAGCHPLGYSLYAFSITPRSTWQALRRTARAADGCS